MEPLHQSICVTVKLSSMAVPPEHVIAGACREAAKMLLCLNSTEPVARKDGHLEDGDTTLVAAAGRDPRLAEDDAAAAGNAAAATVSPLQALVQDIMQQQKQRAQVPSIFLIAARLTVSTAIAWTRAL